jgi:hypothetical protein
VTIKDHAVVVAESGQPFVVKQDGYLESDNIWFEGTWDECWEFFHEHF